MLASCSMVESIDAHGVSPSAFALATMPRVIVYSGSPSGNPAVYTSVPTAGGSGDHSRNGSGSLASSWMSARSLHSDTPRTVAL